MNIVIFGANGPTGRELTGQALAAGHTVTAVTRNPAAIPAAPGLTVAEADATDPAAVGRAVAGADAVLSVLGTSLSRKTISLYSEGASNIMSAMRAHGVARLLAVSSSVLDSRWRPSSAWFFNNVLDPLINRRLGRTTHEDMRRMEALLGASDLAWTAVRPAGLFTHPTTTRYEVAHSRADGLFTARTDLAAAMLRELVEENYVRGPMAVVTTQVRPSIAKLIWREAITKKKDVRRRDRRRR